MPLAFKARGDDRREIVGVGLIGSGGRDAIPITEAAAAGMLELQQRDDDGRLVLDDDGNPQPLSGSALSAAAKDWAEAAGVDVENVKQDELDMGANLNPTLPTVLESSRAEAARLFTPVEAIQPDEPPPPSVPVLDPEKLADAEEVSDGR